MVECGSGVLPLQPGDEGAIHMLKPVEFTWTIGGGGTVVPTLKQRHKKTSARSAGVFKANAARARTHVTASIKQRCWWIPA